MNLNQLALKLDELAAQAAQLDRRRGEQVRGLFDERLFHCQSQLLMPCVDETRATFNTLKREQECGRLTAMRAEYLTERLLAQISAIQRELATVPLRNKVKHIGAVTQKPINVLYQELAQHSEWARRLQQMVWEQQQALNSASALERAERQKTLLATEQRLIRCKAALDKIENQITYRERHSS
ncbi:prepilin peptidase [Vibrio sp. SM6]|uniref:Prepilin peptidase n=1 Tax=Vibrio agarilyticus TaxID=2726741 RepID=A0A7X8YFA6_9VIBR|nr:primosomal replication protein [Vibrio agarilyticus]NLS11320.1 prepilin peptidase [Vibrio agarilyticus]